MYQKIMNKNNELKFIKLNNMFIPIDLCNKDYVEYLNWVDKGNTAEEIIDESIIG